MMLVYESYVSYWAESNLLALDPSFASLGHDNDDEAGEIRMTWSLLVMMCIRRIGNTLETTHGI